MLDVVDEHTCLHIQTHLCADCLVSPPTQNRQKYTTIKLVFNAKVACQDRKLASTTKEEI